MLIPIWWRWQYWVSPVPWTFYGIITSQFGDLNVELEIPGAGNIGLKVYLKENLGFEYDFLLLVAAVHIGWILLFLFGFAYGISELPKKIG